MIFKNTYKITLYRFLSDGNYREKKDNYRVYRRCRKSGLFGWYVDPSKHYYDTAKEALQAMNDYHSIHRFSDNRQY